MRNHRGRVSIAAKALKIWLFLAFVAAMLSPVRLTAQEDIFEGRVADPSGAGIPGAQVKLFAGDQTILSTWADASGSFRVDRRKLMLSAYKVVVSASGFTTAIRQVADRLAGLETVTLEVAPLNESVTVRSQQPGSLLTDLTPIQSVLTAGDIERSNAVDIGEALSTQDGFWMKRKAGVANDVVVRGFQQENINFLIDGARVYGACPSQMDPPASHVDLSQVERVEFTKGPFDVRNEGSLGASVNVVTKAPEQRLSITPYARFGSFGQYTTGVDGSFASERVELQAGYSYQVSDPYSDGRGQSFTRYTNYSALGQNAKAYDIRGGWFKATFSPAEDSKVNLSYTRQQSGLVLFPYLAMDSDYDNTDRATIAYDSGKRSIFKSIHSDAYYSNVIHVMSNSQRTSAMNGVPTMTSPTSARAIGGHLEGALGGGFSAGVESFYRNWNVSGSMAMSGTVLYTHSLPDVGTYGSGAYLTYERAFTPKLVLKGGARYDYATVSLGTAGASTDLYYQFYGTRSTSARASYGSGNVRLSYAALSGVTLFVGAGSAGRIPNAEEFFFARVGSSMSMSGMGGTTMMQTNGMVGNPNLRIPRNTETDMGAEVKFSHLRVTANLFYSSIQNYIMIGRQAVPSSTSGMGGTMGSTSVMATTYNNVDARIYGGELSYDLNLTRGFSFTGNVSHSIGISDPKPESGIYNTNMPEMPPFRGTAALRYVHKYSFAEFGALLANRQNRVDRNVLETPTAGYAVFNVKAGVMYRKLRVNFGANNLFDRFYYQNLSYVRDPFTTGIRLPEPGRSFFGEIKLLF